MLLVAENPGPELLAGLDDLDGLLRGGRLLLAAVEDAYREIGDPSAQVGAFGELLEGSLAEGYAGMCVVADNSRFAAGSDEQFQSWLTWEAVADDFEACRPVSGVCFFDRRAVPERRLVDLAAVHPMLSRGFREPMFQIIVSSEGGRVLEVMGELDALCAEQLHRTLTARPKMAEMVLDVGRVEYVDHRALLVLNQFAEEGVSLTVRNARPIFRRVWDLLDLSRPALEFR